MANPMMQGGFGLVLIGRLCDHDCNVVVELMNCIVVFLTCLLTGTAIGQIYTYFTQYPKYVHCISSLNLVLIIRLVIVRG
jgi:mannose/fructose-specific phosphotransferase system component IIA